MRKNLLIKLTSLVLCALIFFFYKLAGAGFLFLSYCCFFIIQKGLFTNLDLFLTRRREI